MEKGCVWPKLGFPSVRYTKLSDWAEPLMTSTNTARPKLHNHAAQIPVFSME